MKKPLLSLDHFTKTYRSHWTFRPIKAVQDVSLDVYPAESFGFLGHNGAGKTTTIKCIVGLLQITKGRILLEGKSIEKADYRSNLGYLPEQPYFYDHLSVQETLELFASLHKIQGPERKRRVEETLELVHLSDRKKSSVRALSKGLQQRLGLAQALINKPKLLLLDEPFSGLDPLGRMEVRRLLLDLRKQGTTLFLSSHILSDIEDLCDRVAIMTQGLLTSVFELKQTPELFGEAFELRCLTNDKQDAHTSELTKNAQDYRSENTALGKELHLRFQDYSCAQAALEKALALGIRIVSFQNVSLSLEDIFVTLTEQASESSKTEEQGENQ